MPKVQIAIGKRITDAKHKTLVHVDVVDAKRAVCKDHQKCVIARAIQRELEAPWVDVGAMTVLVGTDEKHGKRYYLSQEARKQVAYFDNKGAFAPCTVRLMPYHTYQGRKLGARTGEDVGKKKKTGPKLERRKPTR